MEADGKKVRRWSTRTVSRKMALERGAVLSRTHLESMPLRCIGCAIIEWFTISNRHALTRSDHQRWFNLGQDFSPFSDQAIGVHGASEDDAVGPSGTRFASWVDRFRATLEREIDRRRIFSAAPREA